MQLGLGTLIALILSAAVFAQGTVSWSILPNARTGAPNEELTFLATISNSRDVTMTCQPRFGGFFTRPGGVSGRAQFFTYDGTTLGDTANAFVDIPAQSSQNYVVVLTVDRAYSGNVLIPIRCTDPDNVIHDLRRIPLVNDFQVVIQAGNPPDIVMIGDTLSNDGVARVGETGPRAALMTLAAVNIGGPATDFIVVPEVTGFSTLQAGYRPTICETDANGLCIGPEDTFVLIESWPTDEVRLFAVRLRVPPQLGVPFYPDALRLSVRAGPEPDTTSQDRPAADNDIGSRDVSKFLIAFFGGVSSTLEADIAEAEQEIRGRAPAPVQQCSTQPDGDVGGDWARSGGILIITPAESDDGNFTADGFLEFSDLQFDRDIARTIPVHLDAPAAGGAGTLTLFGAGDGTPVPTDVDYPVTVSPSRTDGSLVVSWDAQPGGALDLRVDGRTRCAPAPAPAIATAPGTADSFATTVNAFGNGTSQTFNIGFSSPFSGQVTVNDFGDFIAASDSAGDAFVAYGALAFPQDTPGLTDEQNAANRASSATAFTGIVAPRGQSGPAAVFMPHSYVATDGDVSISCGVFAYPGTVDTNSGPDGDSDAGVVVLTEDDPAELGDGDCVF